MIINYTLARTINRSLITLPNPNNAIRLDTLLY
jgi:hypothetical protein